MRRRRSAEVAKRVEYDGSAVFGGMAQWSDD